MAESSVVVAGNKIYATEYNNLRKDTLNNTLGHTHNGGTDEGKLVTKVHDDCEFGTAQTEYVSIQPCMFLPEQIASNHIAIFGSGYGLRPNLINATFKSYVNIALPQGAIIKAYIMRYSRSNADSIVSLKLITRTSGSMITLETLTAAETSGTEQEIELDLLNYTNNNNSYDGGYMFELTLKAYSQIDDAKFIWARAKYTKTMVRQ